MLDLLSEEDRDLLARHERTLNAAFLDASEAFVLWLTRHPGVVCSTISPRQLSEQRDALEGCLRRILRPVTFDELIHAMREEGCLALWASMHLGMALRGLHVIRRTIEESVRGSLERDEADALCGAIESLCDTYAYLGMSRSTAPTTAEATMESLRLDVTPAAAVQRPSRASSLCDDEDEECLLLVAGASGASKRIHAFARAAGPSRAPVLLQGEPGTLACEMARHLHRSSGRPGAFVSVSCVATDPQQFLGRLLGDLREPGPRTGLIEEADAGTLHLRNVDALSPESQDALLIFLSEGMWLPLGGRTPLPASVRIIASCNRPLQPLVEAERFSASLYHRLNVLSHFTAPLRDRLDDLPELARLLARRIARKHRINESPVLSEDATRKLRSYRWPGNIRELESVLERAMILHGARTIEAEHLTFAQASPSFAVERTSESLAPGGPPSPTRSDPGIPQVPGATMDEIERYTILSTWKATGEATRETARILGVSVRKIQYRLREWREAGLIEE